jgi:hypothetical protein
VASLAAPNYGYVVTNIAISSNVLTVTTANSLLPGAQVSLLGLSNATFLDGLPLVVATASGTQFTAPVVHADYASAVDTGVVCLADTGIATALTEGTTYETLIDLPHSQIIGTWDASKLINQFVNTGEILFEPQSTYSGSPQAPVLAPPTSVLVAAGTQVTISWTQERSDLIQSYDVEYSTNGGVSFSLLTHIYSGAVLQYVRVLKSAVYTFRVRAFSADGVSGYSNSQFISI